MENERLIHIEVSPNELWIVRRWRKKYRFGHITISIHNGIPQGIEKVVLRDYPEKKKPLDKISDKVV